MPIKPIKVKKCKHCGKMFKPFLTTQKVCRNYICASEYGKTVEKEKLEKKNRKAARELKANNKSFRLAKAQMWFNKFIRLEDKDEPCISCGRTEVEWTRGGQWDAGHYLSRGAFPELRFVEDNAHKQCKKCNGGAGKFAKKSHTVQKRYRINLIEKIGLERVEWLEGSHEPKNYTIEDLWKIQRHYRQQCKGLAE